MKALLNYLTSELSEVLEAMDLPLHRSSWNFGLLVARSINIRNGQGIRTDLGNSVQNQGLKVSANRFAAISGISRPTVMKYFTSWELAAEDGLVPMPSSLTPGSEVDFDDRHTPEMWNQYFHGSIDPQVYFIGHVDRPDLPIKIGKANCVKGRLKDLQTAHYVELEVLLTIPGGYGVESNLHDCFADKHVRGEWYSLTKEDLDLIGGGAWR